MDNLKEMGLVKLNSEELISIQGGGPGRIVLEWAAGRILDFVSAVSWDYMNDPDRQVDLNHARNGGWQQ